MDSRLALTAAVACLAVTAGCSAFVPGDATPDETLTPVSVPDEDRANHSDEDDRTEAGLDVNVTLLATAHERALADTSYRITVRQEIRADGERIRSTTHRRWIGASRETYRGRLQQNWSGYPYQPAFTTVEYYDDGSVAATRYSDGNGTVAYELADDSAGPPGTPTVRDELVGFLRAFELRARQDEMGTILRGTSMVSPTAIETPFGSADPRDGEIRARFGPHGVITSLQVAYTVTVEGRAARVIRTIRLDKIGHTTIEQPSWVAAATRTDDTDTSTPSEPTPERTDSTRLLPHAPSHK